MTAKTALIEILSRAKLYVMHYLGKTRQQLQIIKITQ